MKEFNIRIGNKDFQFKKMSAWGCSLYSTICLESSQVG